MSGGTESVVPAQAEDYGGSAGILSKYVVQSLCLDFALFELLLTVVPIPF